jgi:uracil-DNA glycosylase
MSLAVGDNPVGDGVVRDGVAWDEVAWDEVAARARACLACSDLAATRTTVVVGDPPTPGWSGLVVVGEAPGAEEDASGRPFVGRAGKLLDRLLLDAGLPRERVAVLNALKCRPPGNRAPKAGELANCRPYLQAQLAAIAPRLVLALGSTAVGWFLGRGARLGEARGRVHRVDVGGTALDVVASYHPSAAIRFGPNGAPMAALREDIAYAAELLA